MYTVSVILPVYNAEKFVETAIKSILDQTFADFELIIIDDGSTDSSLNLIRQFNDSRIKLIVNDENRKLIWSLNKGLELAQGKYIARMDADDYSYAKRFELQVKYLDQHPEVILVGSNYRCFGNADGISSLPIMHQDIALQMHFSNPIAHPTVMFRHSVIEQQQLKYSQDYIHLEDINLWFDLIKHGEFHNLEEVLLDYRIDGQNISISNLDTRKERLKVLFLKTLKPVFDSISEKDASLHYAISNADITNHELAELISYLTRLKKELQKIFPKALVKSKIKKISQEMSYSLADVSAYKSLVFALRTKSFSFKTARYVLMTSIRKAQK